MCNLNILIRTNTEENIKGFIQSVTANSFITNHDGEGVYLDYSDRLIKNKNKIDFTTIKDINKSKFIITHQRLSTSGHELKYNHPFVNNNFVLVHNGVINQFKKNVGSDTFGFWIDFNKEFNELLNKDKKKNRHNAIKQTIQNLFKEDKGFYSIFIYDKKTKLSYYFKDSSTNIRFFQSKSYLYITTNDNNERFLNLLNERFKEYKIKDRAIYKIQNFVLFKCEELPQDKFFISYDNKTNDNEKIGYLDSSDLMDYWIYSNDGITDLTDCSYCNKLIKEDVFLFKGKICCEECLSNALYKQSKTQQTTLKSYSGPDSSPASYVK